MQEQPSEHFVTNSEAASPTQATSTRTGVWDFLLTERFLRRFGVVRFVIEGGILNGPYVTLNS